MTTLLRFFPWSRRGLAAALPGGGENAPSIPAHGTVDVRIEIGDGSSKRPVRHTVRTFGPGEVIGIDRSLIIRRTPRPGAMDAEPNYLAAIDFGPPDLPWVFTPSGANAGDQLRPWVALVVVEERDGVAIGPRAGAHLPVLEIVSDAATELQPLDDSWAWAHTQVIQDGTSTAVTDGLDGHDASSSRLVCPRRLDENRSYIACLVPAFRAGVERGLGQTPTGTLLEPAWTGENRVTLVVYDSWRFSTGPQGDFESLATRIRPQPATGTIGRTSMFVGSMWPGFTQDARTGGVVSMDGALQTPGIAPNALDDVVPAVRDAIEAVVETDVERGDDEERVAVGPPLYLSRHANADAVDDESPAWFTELNVDPRARAAAGLGAEVVRRNQEDFVHAAWEQVGAVQDVNRRLSFEALVAQIGRRFVARHLEPRSDVDLLRFASPMAPRVAIGGTTIPAVVRTTSAPDATFDVAMRRLASANNRHLANAARRLGLTGRPAVYGRLAAGSDRIDPTRFGSLGVDGAAGATVPDPGPSGEVDLSSVGLGVSVSVQVATAVVGALDAGASAPPVDQRGTTTLRPDLSTRGVIVDAHIDAVRSFHGGQLSGLSDGATPILELLEHQTAEVQDAVGFVITGSGSSTGIAALRRAGRERLDATALGGGSTAGVQVTARSAALSAGRIVRAGRLSEIIESVGVVDAGGAFTSTPVDAASTDFVIPGLVRDPAVVTAVEAAFRRSLTMTSFGDVAPAKQVVAFDVVTAASVVRARVEPESRRIRRIDATIVLGSATPSQLIGGRVGHWSITPTFDRVAAYPEIRVAAGRSLADVDPERLCPGVGAFPHDTVTLLETNPRFVAAFLGGMNHEMNRELLWRGYPTNRRGTPFSRFWGRTDGTADIAPHDQWEDTALATQTTNGAPKLVLLVRGELLQRYPNTLVVAERENTAPKFVAPAFAGRFDPDLAFFGFDLELAELRTDPEAWIFSFIEPAGEPRFGLDVTIGDRDPATAPATWPAVAWPDVGVPPGAMLGIGKLRDLGIESISNSDVVAAALYQAPFAIEFRAADLIHELRDDD